MDNTSSPDTRLVELTCKNGHATTPILHRFENDGPIGAYCRECRIWIKWVPKTEVWLSLLEHQKTIWPKAVAAVEATIETPAPPPPTPVQGHNDPLPGRDIGATGSEPYAPVASAKISELPEFNDKLQAQFVTAITGLAGFCNWQAQAMGFLDKQRSLGDTLTLIMTEMAELFEAHRHGTSDDPSEHIPAFTQKEEEWADIGVRWLCHAVEDGVEPLRLGQAFVAKLLFNRTRGYRHGGKRV